MRALQVVFTTATLALATPPGWTHLGATSPAEVLQLTFGLKQRNLEHLEKLFWEVSDPDSSKYGQHLSLDAIADIVAPPQTSQDAVVKWASRVGASDVSVHATRDYVSMKLKASVVSKELSADLHRYLESRSNSEAMRALDGYTLPAELQDHVDMVFPLSDPLPKRRRSRQGRRNPSARKELRSTKDWPKDCKADRKTGDMDVDYPVTPTVFYETYNISEEIRSTTKGSMANAGSEDLEDQFNPADINEFASHCGIAPLTFKDYGSGKIPDRKKCSIDGKNECAEGTLDMNNMHTAAPHVPMQYWTEKHGDYMTWITEVNNEPNAALSHSMSSSDPESEVPAKTRQRLDTEFQKAGLRGISLMFATGDSGPWDADDADGKLPKTFKAQYPTSSPYVTAVGGTEFAKCGVAGPGTETSVLVESPCYNAADSLEAQSSRNTNGYSGGGFSFNYAPPNYSAKFVQDWYNAAKGAGELPPTQYWNPKGAGYPDVAALGICENIMGGQWDFCGGTSSSSPFFAGVVGLLNGARLSKGQKPMGFINPWLYKVAATNPQAFHDITTGNNFFYKDHKIGFQARQGWDPVTGLGTPNVGVLVELATAQKADKAQVIV